MATKSLKFVRGRVARFTRLDGCGRPIFGDDSQVVTKGFISVAYTANIETGEEINVTNAAGETCVSEPATPQFRGYTVEIAFCDVDPDIFAMATGQAVRTNAFGDVIGFSMDTAVSSLDTAFALEVWAGAPAAGGCSGEASDGTFGYILLPYVQGGVLGDFTIENGAVTFTVSNATTKDGNAWGVGPYNVMLDGTTPSPLFEPMTTTEALRLLLVDVAPPAPSVGAKPLLDPSDAALTSVTATVDDLDVDFVPVPTGTDPWWVDFGDGTWAYQPTGATISHTYDEPGTYSWKAYRGSSTFTGTSTVTAP